LRRWLAWSIRDLCIALCFHRVSAQKRTTDPQPELTVAPELLDDLLAFLTSSMPVAAAQLFLCFDDGYADAANYVAARAPLHSSVQWLFFVCPEKTEKIFPPVTRFLAEGQTYALPPGRRPFKIASNFLESTGSKAVRARRLMTFLLINP